MRKHLIVGFWSRLVLRSVPLLANASAPYRGQGPLKSGKESFGVKKTPISHDLRKGRFELNNAHFPCGALGIF